MARSVFYGEEQKKIVECGVCAIRDVLYGTDIKAKESLLLCLDKYLDPYYGYKLPFANDIFEILQNLIFLPNTLDVKEDALDLLLFSTIPLTILNNNVDNIEPELLEQVKEIIEF